MSWGHGNDKGSVYQYDDDKHSHRLGNGASPPNTGDLCLCVDLTGDGFNSYLVLSPVGGGLYKKGSSFGAYSFGRPIFELSDRDFHLFLAGEAITLNTPEEDL